VNCGAHASLNLRAAGIHARLHALRFVRAATAKISCAAGPLPSRIESAVIAA
jgi:hypothetical protein